MSAFDEALMEALDDMRLEMREFEKTLEVGPGAYLRCTESNVAENRIFAKQEREGYYD